MNFLKRKMFQEGGTVTFSSDGSTQNINPETFAQQIKSLRDSEVFALKKSADGGQISFTPDLQNILNEETQYRSLPISQGVTFPSVVEDYPRVASGIYGPLAKEIIKPFVSPRRLEQRPELQRYLEESSPFYSGQLGDDAFYQATQRGGRSLEELENILRDETATIPDPIDDLSTDLEELTTSTFDFRDEDLAARQPKYATPPDEFAAEQQRKREEQERIQAEIDASPMLSDTLGTIDPVDSAARRAAFLESVEGLDEFGEPIPGFDKRTSMIEDGIAEALQELTPIENVVDIDRTEADSLMDVEDKFEGKFDKPKIDLTKVDTTITAEMEEANKKRDARQPAEFTDKTKGEFREIFGSDRFLDFIRNVGGELVRTGQIGEGLASGAAKAAEERATRDLLAEQEQKKFDREKALIMAKEMFDDIEGLEPSELNALMKNVDELSENVMNYEGTEAAVAIMNDAISLFDEAIEKGVPITGLPGRIMRFKDEASAFLGIDNPNVSDATKIQNYITQVKQRSIREILNESGRTISNLDREIVNDVFGDLDLTGDPTEIRKKLYNARANLIKNNRDKQRKITSDYRVLQDPAYQGKGLAAISPYEDLILKIIGLDPSVVTTAAVQSASGPQSATVDIQDITL
tara:strand:- start:6748 stop:8658 length:1911 start_codon:yes stop_codon:yes gene_type:complete